jgi:hypothetical protein
MVFGSEEGDGRSVWVTVNVVSRLLSWEEMPWRAGRAPSTIYECGRRCDAMVVEVEEESGGEEAASAGSHDS